MSDVLFEQSDFTQKRNTQLENVKWLVKKYPECEENYNVLFMRYLYEFTGFRKSITPEQFDLILLRCKHWPQFTGIERAFRQFDFIKRSSDKTQEIRAIEYENYSEHFARKKRENEFI